MTTAPEPEINEEVLDAIKSNAITMEDFAKAFRGLNQSFLFYRWSQREHRHREYLGAGS